MKNRSQIAIPTRRSLLSRIKNWDNQESWREFYNTYWRLVHGVARRAGLSEPEAQDVVQETFCQVAKNIPNFRYDPAVGSFKSWLLHTTRWHITSQFRARLQAGPGVDGKKRLTRQTSAAERVPDPHGAMVDELYEDEWKRNLQEAALARVKAKVKPKQYQAFSMFAMKDVPMKEITRVLGMNRNQVYLAKLRITRLAAAEVKRLEKQIV